MQLGGVDAESVLIAHIDRDGPILAQVVDVLIDESQRCIRRPSCQHIGLRHAVLGWQIEIQRRVFGIGRPGRCGGQLGPGEELELG